MVKEYVERLYMLALQYGQTADADGYKVARELADWERFVRSAWPEVTLSADGPREGRLAVESPAEVTATVRLGKLRPEDVRVELVAARDENGTLRERHVISMEPIGDGAEGLRRYAAQLQPDTNGSLVYGVRVVPYHKNLLYPLDLGLARWA
jgi:starch phosphorylase